jgi:hypothetical protein
MIILFSILLIILILKPDPLYEHAINTPGLTIHAAFNYITNNLTLIYPKIGI